VAGWTIAGIGAIGWWAWMVWGTESLEINPDGLIVRRQLFGIGAARTYDLRHISKLRVDPSRFGLPHRMGRGDITFEYDAKTVRCGAGLDEAEARQVVDRLAQPNPRLAEPGTA
jgi:hypothetical protein